MKKQIKSWPVKTKELVFILFWLLWQVPVFSQIYVSKQDATCDLAADGSATVTITGGTAPFTITWSTGASGTSISKLRPGNYSVDVVDANGCSGGREFIIKALNSLKLNISGANQQITFCANQGPPKITLTAVATGGTAPYNYSWPGASLTISSTGTYSCVVTDKNLCTASASVYVVFIPVQCAIDPNEILGLNGYGEKQWVSINDKLPYTIFYENDPDFATAPAQEVKIRMPIDEKADPSSLRIGDFGFGSFVFSVPPNSSFYSKRLNVVDSLGVYVDVIAGLDVVNREAFWIFQSIDPATGLPPNDPQTGYLPVNDSIHHRGEGFVTFLMQSKSSTSTSDTILARAQIKFDINDPINTNVWKNTVDALPPVSTIDPLPNIMNNTSFPLSFSGSDDPGGTGISKFFIYYSKEQGEYTLLGEYMPGEQASFTGQENTTYRFISLAMDHVGNMEPMKTQPDVTTNLGNAGSLATIRVFMEGPYSQNPGYMDSTLQLQGRIPLIQPYSGAPWNYQGIEEVTTIPSGVADWVLIELRDAQTPELATSSTRLAGWPRAFFLKNDGSVVDLTGHRPNIGSISVTNNLYVVIRHRNHVAVMSSAGMTRNGNEYSYDFTTGIDKAYGGAVGYKQIGASPPVFGMVAADIDADGSIFISDFNHWVTGFGQYNGYYPADTDLDGNVYVSDYNKWGTNFGTPGNGFGMTTGPKYSSQVPK